MAPRPTYDPPHVQLGQLMLAARRSGTSFEEWWEEAVRPGESLVLTSTPDPRARCVRWPSDYHDRATWRAAVLGSKDGWRRAFEREPPTEQEAALALLAPGLEALDSVADERAAGELGDGIEAQRALPSAA